MRLAAVLFDVGNTLLHLDYPRVARTITQTIGREVGPDQVMAAGYEARAAVEAALAGGAASDAERHGVFMRALFQAVGVSEAEAPEVNRQVRAAHQERHLYCQVVPGTLAALERLRSMGLVVGAVSNADGTVASLLEGAGLRRSLAFVIDSAVVGIEKPDPRIFEIGLQQAGVPADRALYVGDIFTIDVVGARSAGMDAALVDPLGRYRNLDCPTVPDVTAVPELVSANGDG